MPYCALNSNKLDLIFQRLALSISNYRIYFPHQQILEPPSPPRFPGKQHNRQFSLYCHPSKRRFALLPAVRFITINSSQLPVVASAESPPQFPQFLLFSLKSYCSLSSFVYISKKKTTEKTTEESMA